MYSDVAEKLRFTAKRKQMLQNLVIDENQPGTILHDFNVMLDMVRKDQQRLPRHTSFPCTYSRKSISA